MNSNELSCPDSNDGYDISLHVILIVRFTNIVITFYRRENLIMPIIAV